MDKTEKKGNGVSLSGGSAVKMGDFASNSATDCTGSVPRPPETDAELESYLEVYPFLPRCVVEENGKE